MDFVRTGIRLTRQTAGLQCTKKLQGCQISDRNTNKSKTEAEEQHPCVSMKSPRKGTAVGLREAVSSRTFWTNFMEEESSSLENIKEGGCGPPA